MTKLNFRSAILIATAVLATSATAIVHVADWTVSAINLRSARRLFQKEYAT